MMNNGEVYTLENLEEVKAGLEDELVLKLYGEDKIIRVYVNVESQEFLDNREEYIEETLLRYQEETGIEIIGYHINDYDRDYWESIEDRYDDYEE